MTQPWYLPYHRLCTVYFAKQLRNPAKFTAKLQIICLKQYRQNTEKILQRFFIKQFTLLLDPIPIVLLKRMVFRQKSRAPRNESWRPRQMQPSRFHYLWSSRCAVNSLCHHTYYMGAVCLFFSLNTDKKNGRGSYKNRYMFCQIFQLWRFGWVCLLGLPDAFCNNTSHFVNSARSKVCRNSYAAQGKQWRVFLSNLPVFWGDHYISACVWRDNRIEDCVKSSK